MPPDTDLLLATDSAGHPAFRLRPRVSRELALDPYRSDARHTVLIVQEDDGPALVRCRASSPGSALVEALREVSDAVPGACERIDWLDRVRATAVWAGDHGRIPTTPPARVEGDLPPLYLAAPTFAAGADADIGCIPASA